MDDHVSERQRRFEESLAVIRRVHPQNHPSADDIAQFHELHARHERESGREANAVAAEDRARRVRARGR